MRKELIVVFKGGGANGSANGDDQDDVTRHNSKVNQENTVHHIIYSKDLNGKCYLFSSYQCYKDLSSFRLTPVTLILLLSKFTSNELPPYQNKPPAVRTAPSAGDTRRHEGRVYG